MEGNAIDHFLHSHPLKLIEEEVNHKFLCNGCYCYESLSPSPIYGCTTGDCKFYLHKACAETELPKEMQHFFHPCPLFLCILSYTFKCNACLKAGYGFSYRCERCAFDMHVECARRPKMESESDNGEIIQHFSHWAHPLTLVVVGENRKKDLQVGYCGICDQKLICFDSDFVAYGCEECEFYVHKSCIINIPREINNHFFHPSCPAPLILLTTNFSYRCPGCGDKHVSGSLAFSCGKCMFELDVKCALLPTLDHSKDIIADKIQYAGHQHPLVALKDDNINAREVGCRACGESCSLESDPNSNSSFGCERCNFFIHRQCGVEFEPEIRHYFHPLHPLTLSSLPTEKEKGTPTFSCDSCLGSIDEFLLVYRCAKCDFNLHLDCAKHTLSSTPLLVKYEGPCHSHHHLTFFDKTCAAIWCDICHDITARNCFFRCVACHFNIHLYCHPSAPNTIKHKCHLHPLTLARSPLEYELISPQYQEDSDDEFYCDVCEEKRFKHESVYYCKECKFIAETRCVISELLPCLTGSEGHPNPTGDGRAISADEENSAIVSIADLENKMAELRERKKPLKLEIEQLKARLEELESVRYELKEAKKDHSLLKYQLDHYLKGKQNPTSTSKGSTTADQS